MKSISAVGRGSTAWVGASIIFGLGSLRLFTVVVSVTEQRFRPLKSCQKSIFA